MKSRRNLKSRKQPTRKMRGGMFNRQKKEVEIMNPVTKETINLTDVANLNIDTSKCNNIIKQHMLVKFDNNKLGYVTQILNGENSQKRGDTTYVIDTGNEKETNYEGEDIEPYDYSDILSNVSKIIDMVISKNYSVVMDYKESLSKITKIRNTLIQIVQISNSNSTNNRSSSNSSSSGNRKSVANMNSLHSI